MFNMFFTMIVSVLTSLLTMAFMEEYRRQKEGSEKQRIEKTIKEMAESGNIYFEEES